MRDIIAIDDPADPRVEPYRDIRERDLVGREGLFVAEGQVVLAALLRSCLCAPVSLLIAAKRIGALAPLLARVPEGVPVYAAAQPVIDAVAGFPLHRGILALGRRMAAPPADTLLAGMPERATVLLLSAIANHDNMGGIFRNAAAFGTAAVLLDSDCCDPLYRKAIRVSVGAALLVPFARIPRGEGALALLRRHRFVAFALSPSGASALTDVAPPPRSALLLGAEGHGLAPDLLACSETVRIPIVSGFDSLNVATASGIALHHFSAAEIRECHLATRHESH